jgi:hypothetical protein
MINIQRTISRYLAAVAIAFAAVAGISSCNAIKDELPPCPEGVKLRFVFDYNMEFANAFPSQVDCLTLLVYDQAGNFVTKRTETSSVLADENWRMTIDLPAGKTYTFVAYGGMECPEASFHFVSEPATGSALSSLQVAMNADCVGAKPGVNLHQLFYGNLDLTVPANALDYTEGTVYMMRDTNSLRILLQNVDGSPVNVDDFIFEITADNTLLSGATNDVIPTQLTTYSPWTTGSNTVGSAEDGTEAVLGYAEFSTSRFIAGADVKLKITNAESGETILQVPLVNYLLLLKSMQFENMAPQEYLDREHRWNVILFLDNGRWIDTRIVINDWIVRINNAEL